MITSSSRLLVLALIAFIFLGIPDRVQAQVVNDVMVRYSRMVITKTNPGYMLVDGGLYRHNVEVAFGRGPLTLGLTYQITEKWGNPGHGTPERGMMLTAGYDHILSYNLRLEGFARVGLSDHVNYANPLYATDTDLRVNLVTFHPDGIGLLADKRLFPSAYVGGIVNQFGRVQGIAGAGLWWNRIGTYLTFFHAFNGVDDPRNPGADVDRVAANLNNRGMSVSLSYQLGDFLIQARQNVALKNGGNDLTLALQYRFFFGEEF